MTSLDTAQKVEVASVAHLRKWLDQNHAQSESVWLVTYKKVVLDKYISTSEVLDELLAFGWTDGIRRALDDHRTMQLISPRKTKPWTKSYRDRAERLISEGKMHSAGLASISQAKQTGNWEVNLDVDQLEIPEDLRSALESKPPSLSNFQAFPPSVRRNILRWIASAKKPETRAKRIERITNDSEGNTRTPVNG